MIWAYNPDIRASKKYKYQKYRNAITTIIVIASTPVLRLY